MPKLYLMARFDGKIKEVAMANYEAQQQRFLVFTSANTTVHQQKPLATSRPFKIPKVPIRPSRTKQTQPYRPKTQTQSFTSSNRKDFMKRNSNSKQLPSSKIASSSTKLWKPTLSTASLTGSGHSSGRKIGPLCGTMGKIDRQQMGPLYCSKRFQDTIRVIPPVSSVPIKWVNLHHRYFEKRSTSFSRNRQWKGYKVREFPVFIPDYSLYQKRTESYIQS